MPDDQLSFLVATENDFPVFERLAKSGMSAYASIHGMEWKPELFLEGFLSTENYRIQRNRSTVGVLRIEQKNDHIFVFDLHVEPSYRNQGVGSCALKFIQDVAKQRKKRSVKMCVFKTNPAINLYLRAGFGVVGEDTCLLKLQKDLVNP